jgi:hypothetical protein
MASVERSEGARGVTAELEPRRPGGREEAACALVRGLRLLPCSWEKAWGVQGKPLYRCEERRTAHGPQLLVARDAPDAPSTTRALIDALECLPDGERQVVLLKLLAGWSFAEIAATVGATQPACRMRFMRGLRKLQLSLQEKGLEP